MKLGLRGACLGVFLVGTTVVASVAGGVAAAPRNPGSAELGVSAANVPPSPGATEGQEDNEQEGTREAVYPDDFYFPDEYREVTAVVPEFGGLFVDEAGTLFVYLTAPSDDLALRAKALLVEYDHVDSERVERVVALPARYSWQQLLEWRTAFETVAYRARAFGLAGWSMSEESNQFEVGVTDLERNRPAVEELLASVGVPLDAVHLVEHSGVRLLAPRSDLGWATWAAVFAGALGVAALAVGVLRRLRRRVVVGVADGPVQG
jgi:hypothetical protein